MKIEILSPDRMIFQGEADAVQLPGLDGSLGVLKNHAPLISALTKGQVKVTTGGQDSFYDINGGVVEVFKNRVIVLSE
jgi:F-type H+-transporting ATPase subunit epsilon